MTTAVPRTPDSAPRTPESQSSPEHIQGVPSYLQIKEFDELRDRQREALSYMEALAPDEHLSAEDRDQTIEGVIDSYMHRTGLDADDPRHQQVRDFVRGEAIDNVSDEQWDAYQDENGNPLRSERNSVMSVLANEFAWEQPPEPAPPSAPTDAEQQGGEDERTDDEAEQGGEGEPTEEIRYFTPEQEAQISALELEIAELEGKLIRKREKYLHRLAGNSRRAVHINKDYRKGSVKKARKKYEKTRDRLHDLKQDWINMTESWEVQDEHDASVIAEENRLAQEHKFHRLEATGNYELTRDAEGRINGAEEIERGFIGRAMNGFYEWYGRVNAGGKRFSAGAFKKGAVLGVGGFAVGGAAGLAATTAIAALPVTAVVAAAAGAGVVASKVTKALMATHLEKRSRDANALRHADAQEQEITLERTAQGTTPVADLLDRQAKREVSRNRKRTAIMIGTTATAGAAGLLASELVQNVWLDDDSDTLKVEKRLYHAETPDTSVPIPQPEASAPGEVAGFQPNVSVAAGAGYTDVIQNAFAARGINLSDAQAYDAYQFAEQRMPSGNFLTNNASYNMGGDYGISRSGESTLNPDFLRQLDSWGRSQNIIR